MDYCARQHEILLRDYPDKEHYYLKEFVRIMNQYYFTIYSQQIPYQYSVVGWDKNWTIINKILEASNKVCKNPSNCINIERVKKSRRFPGFILDRIKVVNEVIVPAWRELWNQQEIFPAITPTTMVSTPQGYDIMATYLLPNDTDERLHSQYRGDLSEYEKNLVELVIRYNLFSPVF